MQDNRPHVLIVDDDPVNRMLLCKMMKRAGYSTVEAVGGGDALARLGSEAVDMVFLDIDMPEVSGFDVLKSIRSAPLTADLPVVMVSGFDDMDNIARAIELGADDYITKPVSGTLLQARTRAILARKRLNDLEYTLVGNLPLSVLELAMRAALRVAAAHRTSYGAALVDGTTRRVIHTSANTGRKGKSRLFSHAETNVLSTAMDCRDNLNGLTLVATAEPCPMCTGAAVYSRVDAIAYGTSINTLIRYGRGQMNIRCAAIAASDTGGLAIPVIGGVLADETDRHCQFIWGQY